MLEIEKTIYICVICGLRIEAKDIVPFNVHASTVHRDMFYDNESQASRNEKRLRDYVDLERTWKHVDGVKQNE